MSLLEDIEKNLFYNAAILVDRKGDVDGIYRELHVAVVTGED